MNATTSHSLGAWPAAAYDLLERQIAVLRQDLDELRIAVARLQEDDALSRVIGVSRASRPSRDRSES